MGWTTLLDQIVTAFRLDRDALEAQLAQAVADHPETAVATAVVRGYLATALPDVTPALLLGVATQMVLEWQRPGYDPSHGADV